MRTKTINPSIGGYFKHNNLTYLAKEPLEPGSCYGYVFNKAYKMHDECEAPNSLDCSGKIFQDVTDNIEVELVEDNSPGKAALITLIGSILISLAIVFLN